MIFYYIPLCLLSVSIPYRLNEIVPEKMKEAYKD